MSINETIEHFADDEIVALEATSHGVRINAGADFSIEVERDWDDEPRATIRSYVNVTHGDDRIEVVGHMQIDDEDTARAIAAAILAPFNV